MNHAVDAVMSHLEESILFPDALRAMMAWGSVGWFDDVSATSFAQSRSCTIIFSIDLEWISLLKNNNR